MVLQKLHHFEIFTLRDEIEGNKLAGYRHMGHCAQVGVPGRGHMLLLSCHQKKIASNYIKILIGF